VSGAALADLEVRREFHYTPAHFDRLRRLSTRHTGIVVADDKFDMFYSRLSRRLRVLGLDSFDTYCDLLESGDSEEFTHFVNAITTNLTAFFREQHHFEYLADPLLPELVMRNRTSRRLRVWSAGCSSGEEAYSIAMVMRETVADIDSWDARILATDIDSDVLARAREGIYPIEGTETLGEARRRRWLRRGIGANAGRVRVINALRDMVSFRQLNLMARWPMRGPFDVIFCRNVLIYFDADTKARLVRRITDLLPVGGHLFVGHSESIGQWEERLRLIGKTIYVRER
jgi:chemotaxis protein methyltransferase CheR